MNIYICDDEEKILQNLGGLVAECVPQSRLRLFASGKTLVDALERETCDILLLDIDMPEMSGMEVAESLTKLQKKPLLIFVTSHDELVYESFQYHPYGFVRKRFYQKELPKLLKDCREELERERKHFSFHAEGKDIRVLLSEILYFESDSNYVKLFTEQGEWRFRSTMTAVENALQSSGFIRIHKGFLVNQEKVMTMNAEETELTDKSRLPMGKTFVEAARKQLMRYMR